MSGLARRSFNLYRASWGCLQSACGVMNMDQFLGAVKSNGYKGIEIPFVLALSEDPHKLFDKLEEHDLNVIFQLFTDGPVAPGFQDWQNDSNVVKFSGNRHPVPNESDVSKHISVCKSQIEHAIELFNKNNRLTKLNIHSLRDFHTISQATQFFNEIIPFQESILSSIKNNDGSGLECILHETHRKRFFHSPWMCRDFIKYIEDSNNSDVTFDKSKLHMTADLSHFTCVAETDPMNHEILTNVITKTLNGRFKHIHGRIGYDHGPQVNDPRAPEWNEYVKGFEKWWDNIIEAQLKMIDDGSDIGITFTPEHGPPNYQQTIPYTQQPLTDIWDVNSWIAQRQEKRFNEKYGNNAK